MVSFFVDDNRLGISLFDHLEIVAVGTCIERRVLTSGAITSVPEPIDFRDGIDGSDFRITKINTAFQALLNASGAIAIHSVQPADVEIARICGIGAIIGRLGWGMGVLTGVWREE